MSSFVFSHVHVQICHLSGCFCFWFADLLDIFFICQICHSSDCRLADLFFTSSPAFWCASVLILLLFWIAFLQIPIFRDVCSEFPLSVVSWCRCSFCRFALMVISIFQIWHCFRFVLFQIPFLDVYFTTFICQMCLFGVVFIRVVFLQISLCQMCLCFRFAFVGIHLFRFPFCLSRCSASIFAVFHISFIKYVISSDLSLSRFHFS